MGTSQVQGNLWAARAPDYAEIVEQFGRPLYEEVELMTFRAYHAARRKNEPADEGCFRNQFFGGPHDRGQYGQHRTGRHDIP